MGKPLTYDYSISIPELYAVLHLWDLLKRIMKIDDAAKRAHAISKWIELCQALVEE